MSSSFKEFCKGPGIVITTVMWEFFSLFGMRALLVLYLTQKIGFSDQHAFQIYAGYISLIWISPLVGGWLVDQYLGYKRGIYLGCILIIIGHIVLSFPEVNSLYIGLSIIITGIGFFKTSSICLIGRFYRQQPEKMSFAMVLYYVGGNIGATIAPIICAFLQEEYSYSLAFAAAAFGMFLGLTVFWLGRHQLPQDDIPWIKSKIQNKTLLFCLAVFILTILFITWLLKSGYVGYMLILIYIIAIAGLWKKIKNLTPQQKKDLMIIIGVTLCAMFFWILDQQGSSSISLFILRNINREGIPTGAFQAINPFIIIVFGLILSVILAKRAKKNAPHSLAKIILGISLLTLGYGFITWGAKIATLYGKGPLWSPIISLTLMGMAELFIDPVILSKINRDVPNQLLGRVTAVYYLFVGALANYLSGLVADLSTIPKSISESKNLIQSSHIYLHVFSQITWVSFAFCLILICLLFISMRIQILKKGKII